MSINIISQKTSPSVARGFGLAADAGDVWPALVSGRARIVDSGETDAEHYCQLVNVDAETRVKAPSARRIQLLERVLLGEAPKVVAIDIGCATSTVAAAVSACLRAMGLDGRCNRIPALLVLMLHSLRGKAQRLSLRVERSASQRGERQLVSSARLEHCLSRRLSAGELAVASLLVEGKSYVEIARRRGSAVRTVANQIASVYRKLGISGRIDLLCYLIALNSRPTAPSAHASFGPQAT